MRQANSRPISLKFLSLFLFMLLLTPGGWAAEKPKVRAVTAFVRLEPPRYQEQVQEALAMLRRAKAAYEQAGYEVQTLRITPQPFAEHIRGLSRDQVLAYFRDYEALAKKEGFLSAIGPAMLSDADDPQQADLLAELLKRYPGLDGSIVVARKDGVRWKAVRAAARAMKFLSENTPHSQGNFNFAATALVPANTPFYPGSYHTGPGGQFAVALQSANIVAEAFASASRDPARAKRALRTALSKHAQRIEMIARGVEAETGWSYTGLDLSPAPDRDVSIGKAIENFTGARFGSSATLTAAALITDVLRAIPVKQVGYSGLMLPILEDSVLAQRWAERAINLDALLAYSAVCGTGLDTIPLPGEVTEEQLAQIIGDMASLAVKLNKPLSARLMPVAGKKAGDRTEFNDPFLVNTILHALP